MSRKVLPVKRKIGRSNYVKIKDFYSTLQTRLKDCERWGVKDGEKIVPMYTTKKGLIPRIFKKLP